MTPLARHPAGLWHPRPWLGFIAAIAALATGWGTSLAGKGDPVGRIAPVRHSPPEAIVVPAGVFHMGFGDSERKNASEACRTEFGAELSAFLCFDRNDDLNVFADARPARSVFVGAFEIDRFEVTVQAYRACVAAGHCDVGALLLADGRYLHDGWPMVNVSWQDAVDYCGWQGRRLPTEAEWEKAARGTDGRRWPWGNQPRSDGANHGKVEDDAVALTHGYVTNGGSFPSVEFVPDERDGLRYAGAPGALPWGESPYGAYDMAGNVAEWVFDYYWDGDLGGEREGGYSDLPDVNPVRIAPRGVRYRVVRGGSWTEPMLFARTYHRAFAEQHDRSAARGFRCARDAD